MRSGGAPALMQRWRQLDDRWDMPYLAGYNTDGTTRYIDRDALRAILDPAFAEQIKVGPIDTGLSPQDTVECLMEHEGTEKVILDADNPIDVYDRRAGAAAVGAHEYATCAEHAKVREKGGSPVKYERGLAKLIKFCLNKTPQSVPQDLDCAAFIDDPDDRERVLIDIFKSMGVIDAFKTSKGDVDYSDSSGEDHCERCEHWQVDRLQSQYGLARCELIAGLVRDTHWCSKFQAEVSDGDEEVQSGRSQGEAPSGVGDLGGQEDSGEAPGGGGALQEPRDQA
jgi:hypothetical protein